MIFRWIGRKKFDVWCFHSIVCSDLHVYIERLQCECVWERLCVSVWSCVWERLCVSVWSCVWDRLCVSVWSCVWDRLCVSVWSCLCVHILAFVDIWQYRESCTLSESLIAMIVCWHFSDCVFTFTVEDCVAEALCKGVSFLRCPAHGDQNFGHTPSTAPLAPDAVHCCVSLSLCCFLVHFLLSVITLSRTFRKLLKFLVGRCFALEGIGGSWVTVKPNFFQSCFNIQLLQSWLSPIKIANSEKVRASKGHNLHVKPQN